MIIPIFSLLRDTLDQVSVKYGLDKSGMLPVFIRLINLKTPQEHY